MGGRAEGNCFGPEWSFILAALDELEKGGLLSSEFSILDFLLLPAACTCLLSSSHWELKGPEALTRVGADTCHALRHPSIGSHGQRKLFLTSCPVSSVFLITTEDKLGQGGRS